MTVNTVLGPKNPTQMSLTLMHEHLLIGWPGWEADALAPPQARADIVATCTERMLELKELGVRTVLDPCPIDIGRDVEIMAEVSQRSGVDVICATGLYKEDLGAAPYFRFRDPFVDVVAEMTEIFVREITEGVGDTGIRPGVIKVATSAHRVTPYEEGVLRAAARAAKQTGLPITTHTDEGSMGREQLDILAAEGADLGRVIVGHACGSADLRYHTDLLDRGCYLGFDRFGLELLQPDRLRLAALIGLLGIGFHERIVLSHDCVWCWRGRPLPLPVELAPEWDSNHVLKRIVPRLRAAGVSEEKITAMLVDNPRRYFAAA